VLERVGCAGTSRLCWNESVVLERVGCVSPIERQPLLLNPTKPPSQFPSTQSHTRCRSAISLRGAHGCRYVCPAPIRRTYTPHDAYRTPALHSQPQFPAPSPIERFLTRKIRNAFPTPLLLLTGSHARARARPKRCFFFLMRIMPVLVSLQRGVSGEVDDCMCGASLETMRVLDFGRCWLLAGR
jgi:hypothetical protein